MAQGTVPQPRDDNRIDRRRHRRGRRPHPLRAHEPRQARRLRAADQQTLRSRAEPLGSSCWRKALRALGDTRRPHRDVQKPLKGDVVGCRFAVRASRTSPHIAECSMFDTRSCGNASVAGGRRSERSGQPRPPRCTRTAAAAAGRVSVPLMPTVPRSTRSNAIGSRWLPRPRRPSSVGRLAYPRLPTAHSVGETGLRRPAWPG
jgi:hypothetical protein